MRLKDWSRKDIDPQEMYEMRALSVKLFVIGMLALIGCIGNIIISISVIESIKNGIRRGFLDLIMLLQGILVVGISIIAITSTINEVKNLSKSTHAYELLIDSENRDSE